MEFKKIKARADQNVFIQVAAGHFATNHSHINQYVDLTDIKSRHLMARRAAAILAPECSQQHIDSIICLEGTNMLGAFLAEDLSQGLMSANSGSDICVLTPELNSNNQMIFLQNTQDMVRGKPVMLLLASVSTGKTIRRAVECLNYYEADLVSVCAVFSATRESNGIKVNAVFTEQDLPDYRTFATNECEMCAGKQRIDAIVNSSGFSEL